LWGGRPCGRLPRLETIFTVLRATLLFLAVYAVSTAAVLLVVQLPDLPALRYAVFALPVIGALIVVMEWYDGRGLRTASSPRVESPSTDDPIRSDQAA
jgi:hypothetical protein